MLFLLFRLGEDRYALDAADIVEVLPIVSLKALPRAVEGVAGLFNYHGAAVPVLDVARMAVGKPCRRWMSSRIVLVNYAAASGDTQLLGVLAESVTETLERAPADFRDCGVTLEGAPYLGHVTTDERGTIQRVEISRLLTDEARAVLFQQTDEQPL